MKPIYKNITKYKKKTFKKRKTKKTFKKRKITKGGTKQNEKDDECSICYEKLNNPDYPDITLSCGHTFHRDCMIKACKYMSGSCMCPYCRNLLTLKDWDNLGLLHKFEQYINYKLKDPTTTPLEKLESVLNSFLGTERLPRVLFGNVAIEFVLVKRLKEGASPSNFLERYRLERILNLKLEHLPSQDERGSRKYFRFISNWDAGLRGDDPEQDKIICYEWNEV